MQAKPNHPERAHERNFTQAKQALVVPHLCRPFDRQGLQRALPAEPCQGPDRALGRLRPADPDRLRPRPPPSPRRGRQGRRADLPSRRHAEPVSGHPARRDEHLDDYQCDGGLAARALCRARRGAGRRPRKAHGHSAERHSEGISLARDLHLPAGAIASADQGRDRLYQRARCRNGIRPMSAPIICRRRERRRSGACLRARHSRGRAGRGAEVGRGFA